MTHKYFFNDANVPLPVTILFSCQSHDSFSGRTAHKSLAFGTLANFPLSGHSLSNGRIHLRPVVFQLLSLISPFTQPFQIHHTKLRNMTSTRHTQCADDYRSIPYHYKGSFSHNTWLLF